jgi:hypothetical protein
MAAVDAWNESRKLPVLRFSAAPAGTRSCDRQYPVRGYSSVSDFESAGNPTAHRGNQYLASVVPVRMMPSLVRWHVGGDDAHWH